MLRKLSKTVGRALGGPAGVPNRKPGRARRFVPEVHSLSDRLVPAAISNGVLVITGTDAADRVAVEYIGGQVRVIQNGSAQYFDPASVSKGYVVFEGNDGNDGP